MIADYYEEVHYTLASESTGSSPSFFVSPTSFVDAIRADVSLTSTHTLKLWGQLKGSNGLPLYAIKIELIQVLLSANTYKCNLIATTFTDESGFYFFDLMDLETACYQLITYSRNPLNNKILLPEFNPCHHLESMCKDCQEALIHYLGHHFPSSFTSHQFVSCIKEIPILTTNYALPHYR